MSAKSRPQLIRARHIRAMSQLEVARKLGVYPNTVHYWEVGRHLPRPKNIRAIADLYNVSIATVYVWFGLEPPIDIETAVRNDPAVLVEAQSIAQTACSEALCTAGLSATEIAEICANVDLVIRGYEVTRNQSTPEP